MTVAKSSGADIYNFWKKNINEKTADVRRTEKDRWSKVSSSDFVSENKEFGIHCQNKGDEQGQWLRLAIGPVGVVRGVPLKFP